MKNVFLFFCFILLTPQYATLSAQTTGKINGEVQDSNQKTIIAATVSLLKTKDSSLVKMTLTNDKGLFEFENLKDGDYRLSVTSLGSKTFKSTPLSIKGENRVIQVPPIVLQMADAKALNAVTVTAQKPFIEQKIDRTIVNVDALLSNAGTNAWAVLEKSPGVMTSESGSITLKGKEGVVIFIDDKPTYLAGAALMNYLKSMPSGTLDKIELMSNPPAKYDAAGNAGVINIKTKKSQILGFNGSWTVSYGQSRKAKSNNSLNLNYRNNKVNFFTNVGSTLFTSFNDITFDRSFQDEKNTTYARFSQISDLRRDNFNNLLKLGLDFYATKQTTLGIALNGFIKPSTQKSYNTGVLYRNLSQTDSIVVADNTLTDILKNGNVNLNMRHQFTTKGKELSINADYIKYDGRTDQVVKNYISNADNFLRNQYDLIGLLPYNIDIYSFKTDYSQPLKNGVKADLGAKISFIQTDNTADYSNKINNVTTPNYDYSNHFIYKENIQSAYVNLSKDWKKWAIQSGLRLENTHSKGHQLGNVQKRDSTFNRPYTNLFPTFYVQYTLDTNRRHQFSLNYGRRLDRPYFKDLNPFIAPEDKYTFNVGNPFLKPQFSNSVELAHTFKSFLTTTLSYQYLRDLFLEGVQIDANNNFINRPENLGWRKMMGISVSASLKPNKKWTCNIQSQLTNLHYNSQLYEQNMDTSGTYFFITNINQFQLGKGWSAELSGWFRSSVTTNQVVIVPNGQVTAGFQKKILKNKGTLRLNVSDIFYTRLNAGTINFLRRTTSSYTNYADTRIATLSLSYSFSKGVAVKGRKTGSADEENGRVRN